MVTEPEFEIDAILRGGRTETRKAGQEATRYRERDFAACSVQSGSKTLADLSPNETTLVQHHLSTYRLVYRIKRVR